MFPSTDGFSEGATSAPLEVALLANALSSLKSCDERYAPFPKNSYDLDTTLA